MQPGNYIAIAVFIISVISVVIAEIIYIKVKKAKTKDGYEEHIKEYLSFDEFKPVLFKSVTQPFFCFAKLKDDCTISIIYKESEEGRVIYQADMGFKEFKDRFYLKDIGIVNANEIKKTE